MSAEACIIGRVASYEDRAKIRRFVDALLEIDPAIDELLRGGRPKLVVVKPNWVQDAHILQPDTWLPLITHPVVLSVLLEALAERSGGQLTICVCDAPNTYADFGAIVRRGGLDRGLEAFRVRWPQVELELLDLRRETWVTRDDVVVRRVPSPPDPRGYARLDLGRDSMLHGQPGEGRYYGADYEQREVNRHHRGEVHEYLLAGTAMACDLFINVPKLKTHKKVGVTCCLKNLVGINGDKNWLPHYVVGSPSQGGDEFPQDALAHEIERRIKDVGKRLALKLPGLGPFVYRKMRNIGKRVLGDSQQVARNGDWSGNDTCWRMSLDLNRALLYGSPDGSWRRAGEARHYLALVDGIIGGEGNGPLASDAVASQVLAGGTSPAAVDALACRLMGYPPRQLKIVRHAFDDHRWPLSRTAIEELRVRQLGQPAAEDRPIDDIAAAVGRSFRPHFGWLDLLGPEALAAASRRSAEA